MREALISINKRQRLSRTMDRGISWRKDRYQTAVGNNDFINMMYSEQVCVVNCASSCLWGELDESRMGGGLSYSYLNPSRLIGTFSSANETLGFPTVGKSCSPAVV